MEKILAGGELEALIAVTAAERASAWTSASESEAPREARSLAVARPIPEAAPVMAMTLLSKDPIVLLGSGCDDEVDSNNLNPGLSAHIRHGF